MKYQHKTGARGAFTLIEILVVLVIMGFLIAMVAPKLSGIIDGSVGTTADGNIERIGKVVNAVYAMNGKFPNNMENMVVYAANGTDAAIPSVTDFDKNNGAEFLSQDFVTRVAPQVHILNAAEAKELINMSVKSTLSLAKLGAADATALAAIHVASDYNIAETNLRKNVDAGVPVMMVGVGLDATNNATWTAANTITVDGTTSAVVETPATLTALGANSVNAMLTTSQTYAHIDDGQLIGRMVFGITDHGEAVQSGTLSEAGTSAKQMQNSDQYTWGHYMVVMPRLASTINRLKNAATNPAPLWQEHIAFLEKKRWYL